MSALTAEFILSKTQVSRLDEVRQLDCWCEGFTDVEVLRKLSNVEIVSLGFNHIFSLQPFASCTHLKEIYLRKNAVANLREVTALSALRRLHTLWLKDNPCTTHPHYRDFVLHCCQRLRHLDEQEITATERAEASRRLTPQIIDQILESKGVPSDGLMNNNAACTKSVSSSPCMSGSSRQRENTVKQDVTVENTRTEIDQVDKTIDEFDSKCDDINHLSVGPAVFTTMQTQRTILTAIVTLMSELTLDSLTLIRQEVELRINEKHSNIASPDVLLNDEGSTGMT